jgi:putative transposase
MELNMVRTGIVAHPSQWPFCGYNEIQKPRKKNVLINYDKLMELFGASS